MSESPILVTGGTGLVGRNLVERLRSDGREVVATGSERDLREAQAARDGFLGLARDEREDLLAFLSSL